MERSRHRGAAGSLTSIILALAVPWTGSAQEPFVAIQIVKTGSVSFEAEPQAVSAVLAPRGQQSLTQNWDIDILSPASGAVEPGATFTKTHRRASVQQIWTVVEAEAPHRLTYAVFVSGLETWVFEINLRAAGAGSTVVDVKHTITSLSAEANRDVQEFADTFDRYLESWSASIRRSLSGGPR